MASVPGSWTLGLEGCERLLCGMRAVADEEDVEMLTQPHKTGDSQAERVGQKGEKKAGEESELVRRNWNEGRRKAGREQVWGTVLRERKQDLPVAWESSSSSSGCRASPGVGVASAGRAFGHPSPLEGRGARRDICAW